MLSPDPDSDPGTKIALPTPGRTRQAVGPRAADPVGTPAGQSLKVRAARSLVPERAGDGIAAYRNWNSTGDLLTDAGVAQADIESRRAHYRIDYPPDDRPYVRYGERRCAVINLSERGVLIRISQSEKTKVGETLAMTIEFADTSTIDVEGCVLRRDAEAMVLHLNTRIPLGVIVEQQRQLIAKYRHLDAD